MDYCNSFYLLTFFNVATKEFKIYMTLVLVLSDNTGLDKGVME